MSIEKPSYEELLERVAELEGKARLLEDEKRLKENSDFHNIIYKDSSNLVLLFNSDGFVLDMNRDDIDFLEKKKEQVIGVHFSELALFSSVEKEVYLDLFKQIVNGTELPLMEVPIVRTKGKNIILEIRISTIKKDGRVDGVVISARDVSGARNADQELMRTRKELEKLVNERTEQLMIAQQLSRRDAELRLKAEDERREIEDKFKRIIDNIGTDYLFYSHDANGVFTYVSKTIHNILGYTPEEFMKHYTEYLTSNPDNLKVVERTDQALKGIRQPPYEVEIFHRNGTARTLEVSEYPLIDADGTVTAIEGVARDITEYKMAMQALLSSEDRFRRITENLTDILIRFVPGKGIDYVNPAIEATTGYRPDEIVGKPGFFTSIVHPEDRQALIDRLQSAGMGAPRSRPPFEYRLRTKFGDTVWCEMKANVVYDDKHNVTSIECIGRDITLRLKNEERVRREKKLLENIIDFNPYAIQLLDTEGRTVRANQAFRELTGCDPDPDESVFDPGGILDSGDDDLIKRAKVGEVVAFPERYMRFNDANESEGAYVRSVIFPILSEGEIENYALMHEDVTRSKLAEIEKEALQAQLLQAQKMEAIGTLAGGIAHEFNNILSVIMGTAEMIQKKISADDTNQKRIERIIKSSDRARSLATQLLTFARKEKLNQQVVSVNELVEDSLEILERSVPGKISLTKALSEETPMVWADPNQMHQAILNLCINAIDAIEENGTIYVETSVSNQESSFVPAGFQPGLYCRICVRDTGVGISAENLEKIFEPFFTTKEKGRGTGLGLSITHGIVKNHNGFMKVESEPGKGASVCVFLPITEKSGFVAHTESDGGADHSGGETLMVVDDKEDVLEVLVEMLRDSGYKPLPANGGAAAVRLFKERHEEIDLALLDMKMPDMSGNQVYDELLKINPSIKVIVVSGWDDDRAIRSIKEKGAKWFVQKPYRAENLRSVVRQALDS